MILTQLEGKVTPEHWGTLKQTFAKALEQVPSAIYQTYLAQDEAENDIWRIVTIWKSRQALQDYRASVKMPEGILMFRAAGAEPTLSICEVVDYSVKGSDSS